MGPSCRGDRRDGGEAARVSQRPVPASRQPGTPRVGRGLPTKKLHRTAAGLFAGAFAADSKLADDLEVGHRFDAICNAVMAAAGKGEDAAKLDDEERARLRHQGLDWLRADLVLWTKLLASGPRASRRAIVEKMNLWKQKPDLASIRDAAALARLAADEQKAFAQLWADVEALLKKAAENAPVATPSKAAENAHGGDAGEGETTPKPICSRTNRRKQRSI